MDKPSPVSGHLKRFKNPRPKQAIVLAATIVVLAASMIGLAIAMVWASFHRVDRAIEAISNHAIYRSCVKRKALLVRVHGELDQVLHDRELIKLLDAHGKPYAEKLRSYQKAEKDTYAKCSKLVPGWPN